MPAGVGEGQVRCAYQRAGEDYAQGVEARHAAHEISCGPERGTKGLGGVLRQEAEGLAALQVASCSVLPRRRVEAGGGVEGGPAVAGEVDLDPGVGVGGADLVQAGERVVLAGDVAGGYAGRYPERTGHHHERGAELLAVTASLLEQEILDGIHLFALRRDGEIVGIVVPEVLVHPEHSVVRVVRVLRQGAGEGAGASQSAWRKL